MNKEKQIEEMAKAVCVNCMDEVCASGRCAFQWDCPLSMETIKKLYNAGYRKQKEGEWISEAPYINKHCNKCGFYPFAYDEFLNFCPNCGAKMKGGGE